MRRAAHQGSATNHALLETLRAQGLDCVPRPLKLEPRYEELSYLPGECFGPTEPRKSIAWEQEVLHRIGYAVRRFHDLSVDFLNKNRKSPWFPHAERCDHPEVICHNDLGPWNAPITGTGRISIIDWEMAAPGNRIWDVAQLAWHWVPYYLPKERRRLGFKGRWNFERRLATLMRGYGNADWSQAEISAAVLERQQRVIDLVEIALTTKDPLLANWAAVDPTPILQDQSYTRSLLRCDTGRL